MGVNRRVIEGSSASQNPLPERVRNPKVTLQGLFQNQRASFSLDESILSKHTLFVGGTGCGKTTLFYHFVNQLRQSMTNNDVMVIFDSKGDFYSKFFKQGDFVIGNSSQYQKQSQRWNLFKEILADGWDEGTYELNIQEICLSLFEEKVKQNSANGFFPNAARDLLASIIECLIRAGVQDRNVRQQLFFNDELRKLLDGCDIDKILEILSDYSDMNGVKSYIEDRGGQAMGVLAEMFSAVRDLFIGVFSGHGFFSMREFIRSKGGKVLFIEYDLSIGSVLTPIYRLLFDLALKEALGRGSAQSGNVYLICDEFKLIPNLQHIEDGVNFGRSLGVKIFAGLQSIEQLYEIYQESRGKNIAAGFSSIFAFKANDVTTRQYLSDLYGSNYVIEQFMMNNRYEEEKRMGRVIEDWDMSRLRVGEAIVCLPFTEPFQFKFDPY